MDFAVKTEQGTGSTWNRSNKWKGNCRGWPCQTSDCSCSMAEADSLFLSGNASPLLLPLLHQFPSHQVGKGYPLSLPSPLGTYSLELPRICSPYSQGISHHVLVLLTWSWVQRTWAGGGTYPTKQHVCQFFTKPEFVFWLVVSWWSGDSAPW